MTEDTRTLHQQFVDRQRQSAFEFLQTALKMVEYRVCLGNQFDEWEQRIIDGLTHFSRIPENPSREQLIEQLEFQLECIRRRGENNPKVTWGENQLFKMVNDIRLLGDN